MAKKKHRKAGIFSKARGAVRSVVNITFKIVGAVVALSPTYRGLGNMISSKDLQAGAKDILFDVTGISEGTGPDIGAIVKTGFTVGGGLFIAWLGGQVAKHL